MMLNISISDLRAFGIPASGISRVSDILGAGHVPYVTYKRGRPACVFPVIGRFVFPKNFLNVKNLSR